jgi:hypothetical protein
MCFLTVKSSRRYRCSKLLEKYFLVVVACSLEKLLHPASVMSTCRLLPLSLNDGHPESMFAFREIMFVSETQFSKDNHLETKRVEHMY